MAAHIRIATGGDASAIAAIYRPYVERTTISFEIDPPDAIEMARRIDVTLERFPWLVCLEHGHVVGYAYATEHKTRAAYRWATDVSVYLRQDVHRRGLGRGLYTALFRLLLAQGFVNAYAGITLPNPKSVGLHEALGFRAVGVYERVGFKFDAWCDVGWWQLALQSHPLVPSEPRRWPDVSEDDRRRAIDPGEATVEAGRS